MRIHHAIIGNRFRRAVVFFLGLLLILYMAPAAAQSAGETGNAGIHLPVVEPDPDTPTGIRTTWSCVLFGAYPSAEVEGQHLERGGRICSAGR
jgi:hypothetical protein